MIGGYPRTVPSNHIQRSARVYLRLLEHRGPRDPLERRADRQGRARGPAAVLDRLVGAHRREVVAVPPGAAADAGVREDLPRGAPALAGAVGGAEVPRQPAGPARRRRVRRDLRRARRHRPRDRRGRRGAAGRAARRGAPGDAPRRRAGGGAARALSAVPRHHRQFDAVHWPVRHRVGHHVGLPRHRRAWRWWRRASRRR